MCVCVCVCVCVCGAQRRGSWRDIPYPSADLRGYWDERRRGGDGGKLPRKQSASWDEVCVCVPRE